MTTYHHKHILFSINPREFYCGAAPWAIASFAKDAECIECLALAFAQNRQWTATRDRLIELGAEWAIPEEK